MKQSREPPSGAARALLQLLLLLVHWLEFMLTCVKAPKIFPFEQQNAWWFEQEACETREALRKLLGFARVLISTQLSIIVEYFPIPLHQ